MAQITTEPQLTESEWLNEIEAQLTPPQIETVEAALNKRREWFTALREQLRDATERFESEHELLAKVVAERNSLREQLADAQKRMERQDAIISAYENQDEEALKEAESL